MSNEELILKCTFSVHLPQGEFFFSFVKMKTSHCEKSGDRFFKSGNASQKNNLFYLAGRTL